MSDKDNYEDLFQVKSMTKNTKEQTNRSPILDIGLLDLFNIIRENFILITMLTFLSGVISIFVALTATEVWKAEVILVLQDADDGEGSLASLARSYGAISQITGINIPESPKKGIALAILKSRLFSEEFFREYELLPYLFSDSWDDEKKNWKGSPPSKRLIHQKMKDMLGVSEDRATGILTISIKDNDPQMAAKIANDIVYFINLTVRSSAIKESELKIQYLNNELSKTTNAGSRQMLYGLIGQETRGIMLANTKEDYVFKTIDPATVPELRNYPKRTSMVMTGTIIGGFLSFLLVFLYQFRSELINRIKGALLK